jgi:hypothetical protein
MKAASIRGSPFPQNGIFGKSPCLALWPGGSYRKCDFPGLETGEPYCRNESIAGEVLPTGAAVVG